MRNRVADGDDIPKGEMIAEASCQSYINNPFYIMAFKDFCQRHRRSDFTDRAHGKYIVTMLYDISNIECFFVPKKFGYWKHFFGHGGYY